MSRVFVQGGLRFLCFFASSFSLGALEINLVSRIG